MTLMKYRVCTPMTLALAAILVVAAVVSAGPPPDWAKKIQYKSIRELAGPHAFSQDKINTAADLKAFFAGNSADIEKVLVLAGWQGEPTDLFAAVREGHFEALSFPVGGRLQWMAFRRGGKKIEVIPHQQWDGKKPFAGHIIRFISNNARWAFVVPNVCGNLALFSRMGTDELTLELKSGTATLTDPEGNPIVIKAGETGTVSATWFEREGASEKETAHIPTSVQVEEGAVEFLEYDRPVAVLVEGGNTVSAIVGGNGHMALSVPESNTKPMPIRVGDAVGYISAGAGMAVDWPEPVCSVRVSDLTGCMPGELLVDANASSISNGSISTVEVSATLPDGSTRELGPPDSSGDFRWKRSFDMPGSYRFTAKAVSDKNNPSTNPCEAEVELAPCVPPPPVCNLQISSEIVHAYEMLQIDASGSRSDGGKIKAVVVAITSEGGKNRGVVEARAPFTGEVQLTSGGHYTLKAVAVDDLGQKSENSCEAEVTVRPRTSVSTWIFAGYGSRQGDLAAPEDGYMAGFKGTVDRRVGRAMEVTMGLGAAYHDVGESFKLFADLELNWTRDFGFFGAGFGLWDLTNSETSGSNLYGHVGWDLPWEMGNRPVQLFTEGRIFLDAVDEVQDNYVIVAGIRLRPW